MQKKKRRYREMCVFRLPPKLVEQLARESFKKGMTKTKIVEFALHSYLGIKREAA